MSEELDRIKKAYSSGLKVQIWFNGHWEDFDIRDYSMYPEPFSENRQYRIVGSAYADIAEKRITDLEKENAELNDKLTNLARVAEVRLANWQKYEKENKELKTRVENQKSFLERIQAKFNLGEIDRKEIKGYLESEQLTKAKELLERWLRLYNTNTVKGIITDTRQFIKESE